MTRPLFQNVLTLSEIALRDVCIGLNAVPKIPELPCAQPGDSAEIIVNTNAEIRTAAISIIHLYLIINLIFTPPLNSSKISVEDFCCHVVRRIRRNVIAFQGFAVPHGGKKTDDKLLMFGDGVIIKII